jgi:VanZ family protein
MSATSGNSTLAWTLLAIAVVANIAGYLFNLYSQFWWFDEVIHAYTIFALTLVIALYAYGVVLTGAYRHTFLLILMIAAIGLAIGGLWEVAEWIYDALFTAQNTIKSVPDRLVDLIMDTLGGLVAGWMVVRMVKQ